MNNKRMNALTAFSLSCCIALFAGNAFAKKPPWAGGGGGNGGGGDDGGSGGSSAEYSLACGTADNNVSTSSATLLIGGADANATGEVEATQWLLNHAQGGDYLVIRTGGTGSQAGWVCDTFSSVGSGAELSIDSQSEANDTTVEQYIRDAEVIFIAGGDQNEYEDFWKGTLVNDALNDHVSNGKPIAGTSAGLAILGQSYYAPANLSALTSEVLSNPYDNNVDDINHGDFILHPQLANLITDSHLDRLHGSNDETRYGRVFGFLARSVADTGNSSAKALGIEEGTFVALSGNGSATVYGEGDAFFLRANSYPEQITSGSQLIWNNNGNAVDVYRISGSRNGNGSFNFSNWSGSGGSSSTWFTTGGENGFNCLGGC